MGNPWETHFLDFSNIIWHDNLNITRYHKHRLPISLPSNLTPAVSPRIAHNVDIHLGQNSSASRYHNNRCENKHVWMGRYGMVILWGVYF